MPQHTHTHAHLYIDMLQLGLLKARQFVSCPLTRLYTIAFGLGISI